MIVTIVRPPFKPSTMEAALLLDWLGVLPVLVVRLAELSDPEGDCEMPRGAVALAEGWEFEANPVTLPFVVAGPGPGIELEAEGDGATATLEIVNVATGLSIAAQACWYAGVVESYQHVCLNEATDALTLQCALGLLSCCVCFDDGDCARQAARKLLIDIGGAQSRLGVLLSPAPQVYELETKHTVGCLCIGSEALTMKSFTTGVHSSSH